MDLDLDSRRVRSSWWLQAERWQTPKREFTCCGMTYAAVDKETLLLMRAAHNAIVHSKPAVY